MVKDRMVESTEETKYGWLRPIAASLVSGVLAGIGSFYVAAKPEVEQVEKQSFRSDVILCQTANENRMLIRNITSTLLMPEDIPQDATAGLRAYIESRNTRRERATFRIEDATRPLDCNHGVVSD